MTPLDPISDCSDVGHRGKSFGMTTRGHEELWKCLKWSMLIFPNQKWVWGWDSACRQSCIKKIKNVGSCIRGIDGGKDIDQILSYMYLEWVYIVLGNVCTNFETDWSQTSFAKKNIIYLNQEGQNCSFLDSWYIAQLCVLYLNYVHISYITRTLWSRPFQQYMVHLYRCSRPWDTPWLI